MPQLAGIVEAVRVDDLEPGQCVCGKDNIWTVCDPDGRLSRLEGNVVAVLLADGLTSTGPIRSHWHLDRGVWLEIESEPTP
jgi:hypothetical protein